MPEIDDLNAQVTLAIIRAEHHDHGAEGAKLWDEVARCEQAIADHLKDVPGQRVEYEIAERGVRTAKARADHLRREGDNDGDARTPAGT